MKRIMRAVREALAAARARRVMADLDGCESCGGAGTTFVDVSPAARHMTVRLYCDPCAHEATRYGGKLLMTKDGRPVTRGGH